MSNTHAETILRGGSIFAGKGLAQDLQYVAIRGDRIIAVGSGSVPSELVGEHTEIMDFGTDSFIMPGLHDNHVHLILAGMLDKCLGLFGVSSQEECAELVAKQAAETPDEEWVLGFGFAPHRWTDTSEPTKEALDRLVPDRPVLLLDSELHAAWVNSRALEIAGVDANTQDPPFGSIIKDASGEPTGYLIETALALVSRSAYQFSSETLEDLVLRFMRVAASRGITSVSDMTPYLGNDLSYCDEFVRMSAQGLLSIRVHAALDLFASEKELSAKLALAKTQQDGMYSISYVKQFLDGVPSNYTAMLLDDYSSRAGERGAPLLDLAKLDEAVSVASKLGLSVRLHACGDAAVRTALDAYAKARGDAAAVGYRDDMRHQIEHIEVIDPSDIPRLAKLGVIASVQPEHIVSGIPSFSLNDYPVLLGSARARYTWSFESLRKSGAVLAFGSDTPVVEGDPYLGMYCALERIHPDGTPEGGWNPQEKLAIEDVLVAYTAGAAYAERREHELGTLEPGKLADITVLDRNLLRATSEDVAGAQVLCTMVGGRVVFR